MYVCICAIKWEYIGGIMCMWKSFHECRPTYMFVYDIIILMTIWKIMIEISIIITNNKINSDNNSATRHNRREKHISLKQTNKFMYIFLSGFTVIEIIRKYSTSHTRPKLGSSYPSFFSWQYFVTFAINLISLSLPIQKFCFILIYFSL